MVKPFNVSRESTVCPGQKRARHHAMSMSWRRLFTVEVANSMAKYEGG